MSYKIFISHASVDAPIAKAVKNEINKSFGKSIELFLAQSDINSAAEWKVELRTRLAKSDAIICILTPDSINKPWIYIEWSPFWLDNKTSYLLHRGDILVDALISPMQERQTTNITDSVNVMGFFRSLAERSNSEIPSSNSVGEFIAATEKAQNEKLENSYGVYRNILKNLPSNDDEKYKIAKFFYGIGEVNTFVKIVREIRNDSLKVDIIFEVLSDSALTLQQELEVTRTIAESINSADRVGQVAVRLAELGYLDSPVLREMIDNLAARNRAELRKIAVYLIDTNQEETDLFKFVCDNMKGNFAEFRKVVEHLIISNKNPSLDLIEMFTNYTELKKIGSFMLQHSQQATKQFERIVKMLSEKSRTHYQTLMEELFLEDKRLYERFRERYG
ncbi:MAG TPA: toll/interleukin-1 receptor domain-containing protein [Pyrinomonadaceae bacterium]|nr:toll/interleukin-1 receptor domain-containing protein [Pyrinomonadaceae bacterium]